MSDFETSAAPVADAEYVPGKAVRKPKDLGGSVPDNYRTLAKEHSEHPGRREGGTEAVLRPRLEKLEAPDTEGWHLVEMRRGELFAAAHRARVAAAAVTMMAAAGDRASAKAAASEGVREVTAHLKAAGSIGPNASASIVEAFTDAYANVQSLQIAIHAELEESELSTQLSSALAGLGSPKNWKAPATREARAAITSKYARTETASLHLIVTAPLAHARLTLDRAVQGYMHKLVSLDPDTSGKTADQAKHATYFGPAAERAAMLLERVTDHLPTVSATDPAVQRELHAFATSAQTFVHWALAGQTSLAGDAQRIRDACAPLFGWAKVPALDMTATARSGDDQISFGIHETDLNDAWDGIFQSQEQALNDLAAAKGPDEEASWSDSLFRVLANATLGFIIGGPAGAVGALAEAALPGKEKPSKGDRALGGGLANAVESLATSVLADLLSFSPTTSTDSTRAEFFKKQATAVAVTGTQLKVTVHNMLIEEARRRPDGVEYLKTVTSALIARHGRVASVQKARSVQDWAIYLASATHGIDKSSGGVNLTGVGSRRAEIPQELADKVEGPIPFLPADAKPASGVLEVNVSLQDGRPHVTSARAGLRADDTKWLRGARIGDLRMPVRFVIHTTHGAHTTAAVVVNRNDKGVLWLRDAGVEGRKVIVEARGGDPASDADVLRASAAIIASIDEASVPVVGS